MNRRGFLGMLGAALAGSTVDPEKLLWVPGAKTISIPKAISVSEESIANLALEEFLARYITPAARSIADAIDRQVLATINHRYALIASRTEAIELDRLGAATFLQGSTWNPTQTCPQS